MADAVTPAISITRNAPTYVAAFAMDGPELIEATVDDDGTPDWENAAICDPRGGSPELQAAVREALRLAERSAEAR